MRYEIYFEPQSKRGHYAAVVYSKYTVPIPGVEAEQIGYGNTVESAANVADEYINRMWQWEMGTRKPKRRHIGSNENPMPTSTIALIGGGIILAGIVAYAVWPKSAAAAGNPPATTTNFVAGHRYIAHIHSTGTLPSFVDTAETMQASLDQMFPGVFKVYGIVQNGTHDVAITIDCLVSFVDTEPMSATTPDGSVLTNTFQDMGLTPAGG